MYQEVEEAEASGHNMSTTSYNVPVSFSSFCLCVYCSLFLSTGHRTQVLVHAKTHILLSRFTSSPAVFNWPSMDCRRKTRSLCAQVSKPVVDKQNGDVL